MTLPTVQVEKILAIAKMTNIMKISFTENTKILRMATKKR